MKKRFLIISIISFCLKIVHAQPGNLDSLFGINGITKTNIGANYSYELIGKRVLLQDDGSMFVILQSGAQTLIVKKHPDGRTDSTYGQDGSSNSTALIPISASFQQNNKIVVVGSNFNGIIDEYKIIRYNSDGSIDKSFSVTGTQSVDFPVTAITIQNDGKIVVVGSVADNDNSYFALARFLPDGGPDISFSKNGKQTTDFGFSKFSDMEGDYPESDQAYSVAVQDDGKMVVAGSAFNYADNASELAVARYNPDGSLDVSFNKNGMQVTNFGASENYGYSIAFQQDKKIVVAGYANLDGNSYDLAVARYNTNGSPDYTFDQDGKQTTSFKAVDHSANNVAVQNDGKIVVQGGSWDGNNSQFSIVRYTKDGSLDNTFNSKGKQIAIFGSGSSFANSIVIQSDGKIIEVGYTLNENNSQLAIVRYNANGTFDNTFKKNGKLIEGLNKGFTFYTSTAIQQDGKIIAAGYAWNGLDYDFAIARYNANGIADSSFSNDGKQMSAFASGNDLANSIAVQSDGKIVAGGYTYNGNSSHFAVARYNTDGTPDTTFNHNGKQVTDFGYYAELGNAVAIQSDGKIILTGSVFTGSNFDSVDFAIARYNKDGSLDKTFSGDGKELTDFSSTDDFSASVALQKDGKILIAGRTTNGVKNNFALVRYNVNGTLDYTFGNNGKQVSTFGDADYFGKSIAIQADGKIVVAGYSQVENVGSSFAVARYTTNGKLDTAFNKTGFKTEDFGDGFESANAVAIQGNGKIIVAGGSRENFALVRLNAHGVTDSTFSNYGLQVTKASEGDDIIQGISIINDNLYVVGYGTYPATFGVVAKYLLNESSIAPTVSLITPTNNATYLAPAAHIKLSAAAADKDGTISKVEFYNGTTLLHTETVAPYGFIWRNVPRGNYIITAKATDNSGLVTTSVAVHIAVVANKAPLVSIMNPANSQSYPAPATIHLEAAAKDPDGRITKVEFYSGATLLRTERKLPYSYYWRNVSAGTYTITAVATDNYGLKATSAFVTVTVTNAMILSSKPYEKNDKSALNDALQLRVFPNPARGIVNVSTTGLQRDKPALLSIFSAEGVTMKTMQMRNLHQTVQLDVSSFVSGVYTLKVISEGKVVFKQFVKL